MIISSQHCFKKKSPHNINKLTKGYFEIIILSIDRLTMTIPYI
jgi:hypothetical protein